METSPFFDLKNDSPYEISFRVKDVDLAIINSIRRLILSEIKNVGFFFDPNDFSTNKDITITHNDTPLHNEFLQHRISLIPINVSVEQLENWNQDQYDFVINKENNTNSVMNIYSNDIIVVDSATNKPLPDLSKQFFPPDPITKDYILITKLNPNKHSKILVVAKASLKSPSVSTSFGMISNISIEFVVDELLAKNQLDKYIEANKDKNTVENLTYQFNSIERERYYYRNKYREPNRFEISLTSECSIPCSYIIRTAIQLLKNKVADFQNSDYEILNHNMLFTVVVHNEGHTLGNLFQSLVFNHFIREDSDNKYNLEYVGYNIPHPLEKVLLIKLKGSKLLLLEDVRDFIKISCDHIINILNDMESHWNSFYISK